MLQRKGVNFHHYDAVEKPPDSFIKLSDSSLVEQSVFLSLKQRKLLLLIPHKPDRESIRSKDNIDDKKRQLSDDVVLI